MSDNSNTKNKNNLFEYISNYMLDKDNKDAFYIGQIENRGEVITIPNEPGGNNNDIFYRIPEDVMTSFDELYSKGGGYDLPFSPERKKTEEPKDDSENSDKEGDSKFNIIEYIHNYMLDNDDKGAFYIGQTVNKGEVITVVSEPGGDNSDIFYKVPDEIMSSFENLYLEGNQGNGDESSQEEETVKKKRDE